MKVLLQDGELLALQKYRIAQNSGGKNFGKFGESGAIRQ